MSDYHVVIGLGLTGQSVIDYYMANQLPIKAIDTRVTPPGLASVQARHPSLEVFTGGLDRDILLSASCIIISPGLPVTDPLLHEARAQGIEMISDIELFARCLPETTKIVAITGTNGKSTVTSLVGHMAKAQSEKVLVGGNLGVPVLSLLLEDPEPEIAVLELSSFQLESTYSLKPTAATILNVTADHLDRHQNLTSYHQAKQRIFFNAQSAVFNRQDALTIPNKNIAHQVSFGLDYPPIEMYGIIDGYLARGAEKLLPVSAIPLMGEHHWSNTLAALALGELSGLDLEKMLAAIATFQGLAHRCQHVATIAGVDYYNDSKATNVGATKAAIEGLSTHLSGDIILIAGGQSKGADFSPLAEPIAKQVKAMVLIGECASQLETQFNTLTQTLRAKDMHEAVQLAQAQASRGDAVVLAPACASFDMFTNFEFRGQCFIDEVRMLNESTTTH